MFPYFKPASLGYIAPSIERVLDIYRIFSFVFIVGVYLYYGKYSKLIICIIIYQFVLLFSTILHNGNYWRLAVNCGTVVSFSMLTEILVQQNSKLFFKAVTYVYSIFIPLDLLLYFIFPNGFGKSNYYVGNICYFLGLRNGFAPLFIPITVCLCLFSCYYGRKLKFLSLCAVICGSLRLLITWSATGVLSGFILIFYIVFLYKSHFTKLFNIVTYYIVFVLCQICFVFFRFQDCFSYIIEFILKKSITFTGRTEIWDKSFILIKNSLLFGYGVYEGHGLIRRGNLYYYAHNGILEVLLQGGIIALGIFILLFIVAAIPLYKYRNHYISGIVSTGIFSLLVIMLAEATISDIWLYSLLIIANCIPQIIVQVETGQDKRKNF